MSYFSGIVAAVPSANRQSYLEHARKAWPHFAKCGALRMVETWGEDIPDGKITDFKKAVQATEDETVVFSWIEWPDRATADASWEKMQNDPEMASMGEMPFDGSRMIWGGFAPVVSEGNGAAAGYYSGFVVPVPADKRQAYVEMADKGWEMFSKLGALCDVEAWGEDVPHGKKTDFYRAVKAEDSETIVFAWVGWPDRKTADAAYQKMMSDPDMSQMGDMPFDGKRMFWGGFAPLYDTASDA